MAMAEKSGVLRAIVRGWVRFYYPRIEVTGGELIPREGPVLLAANHPNSLIDPVMLGIAARRPVRLMAKATLFSTPVFGSLLRALGMVPAYRGSDDAKQVSKNLESLAAAGRQVAAGGAMGIFPEGKSHDATQLALVRSGAARLAMQAAAAGARGLKVVPVGLNYERKERFRSAVWIKVGRPIAVDAWLRMHGGDEHLAMRTMTQELSARLKRCVVHLDNPAWENLLDEVEALLPVAEGPAQALARLHQRKRVADAINHAHKADSTRAEAAAQRVHAYAKTLEKAGMTVDAFLLQRRGWRLAAGVIWGAVKLLVGGGVGLIGLLHHAVPYGLVRLIAGRLPVAGRMVVALSRLGLSLPIYAIWYAFVWWRMSLYFVPWVAWAWMAAMPWAGLVALALARKLRVALPAWRAELKLWFAPQRAAALRKEGQAVGALLAGFATPAAARRWRESGRSRAHDRPVIYRPPVWITVVVASGVLALLLGLGAWLWRDRPIEVWRQHAPALHEISAAELPGRIAADERSLDATLTALRELEARFEKFEAALLAGDRSYYRPEDDDEIRRMLMTYLSLRTALLRTVWHYQRHAELADEALQLRALLLHYTAAAVAYDYAGRFVLAFEGRAKAIKKLNEGEPRWDLPPGTYDAIRANLAHVSHRRWLEAGWRHYHETLPRWQALGLYQVGHYATFHAAIRTAGERTARLSEKLFKYKLHTALADVGKFARGGWYRASSAVSTLIGDARIREPRGHAGLIAPAQVSSLREKLWPGDVVIERRNWYLSNAFLPGYWPHSALYVGTADELRALGVADDPRVAKHLAAFARKDAAGHAPALIEAISEGVVFTTLEYSVGGADSVAVLRPRLTDAQRREVVARAFSHVGKPYDFDFDFFSADKLVCTEVVYRALGSYVDLPLVEIMGRKTLPALEIVRFWSSPQGAPQLEFVAFLDGDEASGTSTARDAEALKASLARPALTWLQ